MYGRSPARLNGQAWRQGHPSLGDLMARTDAHPTETWLKTDVTWVATGGMPRPATRRARLTELETRLYVLDVC
jgi:hypothetical protein